MGTRKEQLLLSVNDAVLAPLITAAHEEARRFEVETVLVEHVRPVIDAVISRHVGSGWPLSLEDADDIASTVSLRLIAKLQAIDDLQDAPIASLEDYVATATYRTIYDFNRRRYPERTRLRKRLRYVLTRDRRFAWWEIGGAPVCGLRGWLGSRTLACDSLFNAANATPMMRDDDAPADALEAIFRRLGGPIAFDSLVRLAAELWGIRESRVAAVTELTAVHDPVAASRLESMQFLSMAWQEIRELRPMQRAALLLNLRDSDGANATSLLVMLGIASFEDVAEAAGLSNEQLSAIWRDLPLDDLTIAETLGISRQQVINLRKSARERLARRLRKRSER